MKAQWLSFLHRFKEFFQQMKITWKSEGFKGLYKKYGFKLFVLFFFYYLIRDSLIYIVIPWLVAKHFIN